eukprot:scaffold53_cov193-Pinguiococcus_pyrenoidosus.AAC.48
MSLAIMPVPMMPQRTGGACDSAIFSEASAAPKATSVPATETTKVTSSQPPEKNKKGRRRRRL